MLERVKIPKISWGMGTLYFWSLALRTGTTSLETVLNSIFSLAAEIFPMVLVGIVILSTRKVVMLADAKNPSTAISPVNLMSVTSSSTASSVESPTLGQN